MKTTLMNVSTVSRTLCRTSTGSVCFGSCCGQDLHDLDAEKQKKKNPKGYLTSGSQIWMFSVATSHITVYIQEISDI